MSTFFVLRGIIKEKQMFAGKGYAFQDATTIKY